MFAQLVFDDVAYHRLVGKHSAEIIDLLQEILVFGIDLFVLKACQLVKPQVQDRICLAIGKTEPLVQLCLGAIAVIAVADDAHHLVEVVDGFEVAFEDMGARFGLYELKACAAAHHVNTVVNPGRNHLLNVHRARHSLIEGEHDATKGDLQVAELIELVDDDFCDLASFEVHHDAHPVLVGFIAQVDDAGNLLGVDKVGDLFDQACFVDVIRNLVDNDRLSIGNCLCLLQRGGRRGG